MNDFKHHNPCEQWRKNNIKILEKINNNSSNLFKYEVIVINDESTCNLRGEKRSLFNFLILNNENTNFHYVDLYQHCFEEIALLNQLKSYELKIVTRYEKN